VGNAHDSKNSSIEIAQSDKFFARSSAFALSLLQSNPVRAIVGESFLT
jgi:hypothetical protein